MLTRMVEKNRQIFDIAFEFHRLGPNTGFPVASQNLGGAPAVSVL